MFAIADRYGSLLRTKVNGKGQYMIRQLVSFFILSITLHAGVPTMGLSNSNADFKIMAGEGPQDTLRRALNVNGTVHILPGSYQFTAPLTGAFNNVRITGTHGAVLKSTTSGTSGIFDFTGNNVVIDGLKFLVETWVNDQNVIEFNGDKAHVTNCLFDVTTSSGSSSNPMTLVYFENCYERTVSFTTMHPNKGVRCIFDWNTPTTVAGASGVNSSNGLKVIGCNFSIDEGFLSETSRQCYRVIDAFGSEFGVIQGNRFFQLGSKAAEVDSGIFIRKHSTLDGFDLLESGHWSITGNVFERVASPTPIKIWGAGNVQITANMIGLPALLSDADGTPDASGEATIVVTGADGTRTGTAALNPTIVGNDIHNFAEASTDGAAVYLGATNGALISGNNFSIANSNNVIRIDSNKTSRPIITANSFQTSATPNCGIYFADLDAGAGSSMTSGAYVGGNAFSGFTNPILDESLASASTRRKVLTGIQDGYLNAGVQRIVSAGISFNTTSETISNTLSGMLNFGVGDVISISGATDQANNVATGVLTSAVGSITVEANLTTQATPSAATAIARFEPTYTFKAVTVTFDTTADTIADSASGFGLFRIGDVISISGSTQANNVVTSLTAAAAGSLSVAANLTTDGTAGETIIIRRVDWDQSYTAATVTFDTTAETITDSASLLGFLSAGDVVAITGSSAQANNVVTTVLTAAAGNFTVAANLTTDASAGEVVTIRRLKNKPTTNVNLSK